MSAPAGAGPAQPADAPSDGDLTPHPWRLEDTPPGPGAMASAADSTAPLLLLHDRRQPVAADLRVHLEASLSTAERQRLGAYRLPADRERFLLGRGGLRRLLGAWLALAPEAVPLATGPHGKPHCPIGPPFNLSHAGDLILLALHPNRPVGVDVERLRPELDWWAIARRVLPTAELEALATRPAAQRPDAFLTAWCRLEARLKARGDGLAGLERLRRQIDGASPETGAAPGERLWDVAVPAGYRAAVALAPLAPQGPGGSGGSSRSIRSSGVSG